MKVKKIFRASRGRIAATHTAFASGRTTQKMLPTGLHLQIVITDEMAFQVTYVKTEEKWTEVTSLPYSLAKLEGIR